MTNDTALVLLDYINEIVHPTGKLAAKGYANFIQTQGVYDSLQKTIDTAHSEGDLIIAVGLAFDPTYVDQPIGSPIFGKAAEFGILQNDTWSTDYTDAIKLPGETVHLTKNRVSAFTATVLDQLLRNRGVRTVRLAGVASDLAVEATARAAHDLDYIIEIAAGSSAAASTEDHERALTSMSKFATIL
ncbi:MAG TPA: isochorismatase family cysteine hydrolase [Aeromicrobium sp.]|nr:isochorismatase family cysteine hydrolase [Aeromicrobium sp.]